MELTQQEQRQGYDIWTNERDEEYLVLRGLDPNQVHTPGVIESFMIEHYTLFAAFYWIMIVATFTYLIIYHIFVPLLKEDQSAE